MRLIVVQSIDFGPLHPMFRPTGLTWRFGRPPRKATGFVSPARSGRLL